MNTTIRWGTNHVTLSLDWSKGPVTVTQLRMRNTDLIFEDPISFVQVTTAKQGHTYASSRLVHTVLGDEFRYLAHHPSSDGGEALLEVELATEDGLHATATFTVPSGCAALRCTVSVRNMTGDPVVLRSVATWASRLGSLQTPAAFESWSLLSARTDWLGESRWSSQALRGSSFPELSEELTKQNPRGDLHQISTGTWSTGKYLPTAALVSPTVSWLWQIEHNGPWRWEVGEDSSDGYLAMSGPTEDDHSWFLELEPGQHFTTVPIAVTIAPDVTVALAQMTAVRRRLLAEDRSIDCPVVFNDYMNALNGDPEEHTLLPLIDAASRAGAEVFLIDAGWYDDGFAWWDSVGEWKPSSRRFPNGLSVVVQRIRELGMIPGLWLEPEVVGVRSPIAHTLPDEAFLLRRGQRIVEQGRYHLDLRHEQAVAHLDEVVDRLISDFGIGYFKLDYNINPGAGSDFASNSLGAALLDHNRAHVAWLRRFHTRHPQVMLENCGSGAMRADYALLTHFELQSSTDQQDERRLPAITSSTLMSVLPEQAAFWAYPQHGMGREHAAFCLATPMLGRYLLSGLLSAMDEGESELVAEAVTAYKSIRHSIPNSTPFWPSGLPTWESAVVTAGLHTADGDLITVWSKASAASLRLPMPHFRGLNLTVTTVFPASLPEWPTIWDRDAGILDVQLTDGLSARTLRLTPHPQ